MTQKRVLLIIPAYNEEQNIEATIRQITAYPKQERYVLDYIVIDDGSTDRTGEICRQNQYPCVHLVQNLGIGGAVQTGYLYASSHQYDAAVQFDGDGQHDIRSLNAILAPILEGTTDFCVGSRFLDRTSQFRSTALRQMGIRYLSVLLRVLTGLRISDPTSGYRAASAAVAAYFSRQYPVDYPEPESLVLLQKKGFRVSEAPVNMFPRNGGRSSIGWKQSIYYMIKVSLATACACMQKGG